MINKIKSRIFLGSGDHSLAQVGYLYGRFAQALDLLCELQQPPRCTDEREIHEKFAEREQIILDELDEIAREIFVALTNKKVLTTKEKK